MLKIPTDTIPINPAPPCKAEASKGSSIYNLISNFEHYVYINPPRTPIIIAAQFSISLQLAVTAINPDKIP